jgi:hypothetical protein
MLPFQQGGEGTDLSWMTSRRRVNSMGSSTPGDPWIWTSTGSSGRPRSTCTACWSEVHPRMDWPIHLDDLGPPPGSPPGPGGPGDGTHHGDVSIPVHDLQPHPSVISLRLDPEVLVVLRARRTCSDPRAARIIPSMASS